MRIDVTRESISLPHMARGDADRAELVRLIDEVGESPNQFAKGAGIGHKTIYENLKPGPDGRQPRRSTMTRARAYHQRKMIEKAAGGLGAVMPARPAHTVRTAALFAALRASGVHQYSPEMMVELVERLSRRIATEEAASRPITDEALLNYAAGILDMLSDRNSERDR